MRTEKDKKYDREKISYKFFAEKQKSGEHFSATDIANATGWSASTIRTYIPKKWKRILTKGADGKFTADISAYKEEQYIKMMSQNHQTSIDPFKPDLPELVEELLKKARDSAILAVDIYNRPVTSFRSQGYIVMMIIAWTALFHAIFESTETDYFHKDDKGEYIIRDGDKKAWELSECIKKCGDIISSATKENLNLFIKIRNKIEHRYIPEFDLDILGECQALLLNFENLMEKTFGSYYALSDTLAIPLQATTTMSGNKAKAMKAVQAKHYSELKEYLSVCRSTLPEEIRSDSEYSFRVFLIPQVWNKQNTADCAVEFIPYNPENAEEFESLSTDIALIKEKRIPVVNQGMYRPKQVCDVLTARLNMPITRYLHTLAWKFYQVRGSEKNSKTDARYCCFDAAHGDYVYTQAWIDFLAKKFSDPDELQRVKAFRWKE